MDKSDGRRTRGSILKQITALYGMPTNVLKERFLAMFPEKNAPSNKDFLCRRIAYKLQEDAFGSLSTNAADQLNRLKTELDPLKDLGQRQPQGPKEKQPRNIPLPGTIIMKVYKGRLLQVKVLQKGFEYEGKSYRSLTHLAREITGVPQSGFVFFFGRK